MYFRILLMLHIVGAIYGFGPAAVFGVLDKLSHKFTGEGRRALLEALNILVKRSVIPFSIIQPLTGVLLIFELGLQNGFFQQEWLWISILLYVALFLLLHSRALPALRLLFKLELAGKSDDPRFAQARRVFSQTGILLALITTTIIVLMSSKPGGPAHL